MVWPRRTRDVCGDKIAADAKVVNDNFGSRVRRRVVRSISSRLDRLGGAPANNPGMARTPRRPALRKAPGRYHHGDLRNALLAAAWSALEQGGIESLSLRSLAQALGVSYAAPANHFSSKEDLLD